MISVLFPCHFFNYLLFYRASSQKSEKDAPESNGQTLGSTLAYENPAISVSSNSINHLHRRDSGLVGSNNFLGEFMCTNLYAGCFVSKRREKLSLFVGFQ